MSGLSSALTDCAVVLWHELETSVSTEAGKHDVFGRHLSRLTWLEVRPDAEITRSHAEQSIDQDVVEAGSRKDRLLQVIAQDGELSDPCPELVTPGRSEPCRSLETRHDGQDRSNALRHRRDRVIADIDGCGNGLSAQIGCKLEVPFDDPSEEISNEPIVEWRP